MKRVTSILAILFILGAGSMLAACGPPEDIDEDELEEAMEQSQDGSMDEGGMGDDMEGGGDDW
jgi:hypothetical protein